MGIVSEPDREAMARLLTYWIGSVLWYNVVYKATEYYYSNILCHVERAIKPFLSVFIAFHPLPGLP